MDYKNIKFVNEEGIGILTISRPKALNALNTETVTELNDCVGKIENDESVKVVIITGDGAKSFVAGADIVEMSTKNPVEGRKFGKIPRIRLLASKTFPSRSSLLSTVSLSAAAANSPAPATSVMLRTMRNSASLKSASALPRVSAELSVFPVSLAAVMAKNDLPCQHDRC